jgi:hypothetical protein
MEPFRPVILELLCTTLRMLIAGIKSTHYGLNFRSSLLKLHCRILDKRIGLGNHDVSLSGNSLDEGVESVENILYVSVDSSEDSRRMCVHKFGKIVLQETQAKSG